MKYTPEQFKTEAKAVKGEYDKNSASPFSKMHEVMRETAFRNPESYFRRYAALNEQEAVAQAESIWAQINEPNLERNIRPTLGRASLVLRKGADHNVTGIRLRKV